MKSVYIFVRNDIPKNRQVAQACHSGMLSSDQHKTDQHNCRVIVLSVKDISELFFVQQLSHNRNILTEIFFEPDLDKNNKAYGFTALATQPIDPDLCDTYNLFPSWKAIDVYKKPTILSKFKKLIFK